MSHLASFGTATRALGAIPAGAAFPATLQSGRAESLRPGRPRSAPFRRLLRAQNGQTGLYAHYPTTALSFSVTLPFPPGNGRSVCSLSRDSSVFLCDPSSLPPIPSLPLSFPPPPRPYSLSVRQNLPFSVLGRGDPAGPAPFNIHVTRWFVL